MEADDAPRAVVVLRRDDREVLLGPVYAPGRCDLSFVEDLLRVQLAARGFGWSIRLTQVHPDLRELVDLVGLDVDLLSDALQSSFWGDPSRSGRDGSPENG